MMRTKSRLLTRHLLAPAFALGALAATGCGKQPEPAPAPTPPSAVTAPEKPAEPPPAPPSPLADAEAALAQPVETPEAITAALQKAEELATWAEKNPGAEAAKARLTSARLRLVAVAAAAGLDSEPAQRALGGEAKQLAGIRATLDLLAQQPAEGVDPKPVADAVQAILGADPEQKEVTFDRGAAEALAKGTTLEGAAVRVLWLARYQRALEALTNPTAEMAVPAMSRAVGRLLCATCADAHHVTPDVVTRFLLNPKNTDGVVCASAVTAAQEATTATAQLEAMATCREALGVSDPTDPALFWGTNALAAATLTQASALANAPAVEGALATAAKRKAEAVGQRLSGVFALPVPVVVEKLPESGERVVGTLPAMVDGLGVGGLTATRQALPTVVVGPDAVKIGLRPLVEVRDGKVVALNPELNLPSGGRSVITLEALAEAEPAEGQTGVAEVMSGAAEMKLGAEKVAARVAPAALGAGEVGGVVNVAVDAQAPAWAVVKTLDGLKAGGFEHVRFLKTATHTRQLPLVVRQAPEAVTQRTAGFARPLIAVVGATHVDVWTPEGDGPEGVKKDADAKMPEGLEPGYKGKALVRLRVPIPEGMGYGLTAPTLQQVDAAIGYFEKTTGATGTLHVVAGEGARAADVLRVAQAYQEKAGKELADPTTLWPEVTCGGPEYVKARRTPEGCATAVAVAFSAVEEPSSKGIRDSIVEKKDAPPKKAEPPPQAGFCNQNDIRVNMNKRMGSFRFCYERELQLKNSLEGRVVLKFTIGPDGSVQGEPTIASATLKDESVHKCMINNVKKVKFGKPEGGVCVVQYPFVFQNKGN